MFDKKEVRTAATTKSKVTRNTTKTKAITKPKTTAKKVKPKFSISKIKAIAEQAWWRKTSEEQLAKDHNLTVDQVRELRRTSEYLKEVENLLIGQYSAEDFEEWVENPLRDMPRKFGDRMGIDPGIVLGMVERVRKGHAKMAAGKMKAPQVRFYPYSSKLDTSQVKIIGETNYFEFVYLYYFPKLGAQKRPYYSCKIGKTKGILTNRVAGQIDQQPPEKARLALVIRTDDCGALETKIHNELKMRKKWLDPKLYPDIAGREWFLTNPAEVKRIVKSLL